MSEQFFGIALVNASKEKCERGHSFNKRNTYWRPNGQRDCRICGRERARRYAERNRARLAKRRREWKRQNREKICAHASLYKAVRSGKLERPAYCEICAMKAPVEGHHEDYAKPLDVRWLCAQCHKDEHRR